ncbi:unnamed protein product [Effrenium voratum]|nr:unnamed protein product [Effrenium voratum]
MAKPPVDVQRGSWFAKHGGARLRFGGLPGGANVSSSGSRGISPARSKLPSVSRTPQHEVSDALDDLLMHARATLKQLDALRAQQAAFAKRGAAPPPGVPKASAGRPPGFWRPSCKAHLWSGNTWDFENGLFDSDDDLESTESEGSDFDWDLLRGKRPASRGTFDSPAAQAARASALPKRGFSVPPFVPPPPRAAAPGRVYYEGRGAPRSTHEAREEFQLAIRQR